jgi:transcriptional regulator with XRE-family HTH domain
MSEDEGAPTDPAIHLTQWRLHRGLTQMQVQQRFGWAEGRLSKLESGAVSPKPATLSALARLYGCDMGDLFALPPAETDKGLFGISELRRLITRVQQDMAELKAFVVPRIEAIEGQLAQVDTLSEAAAKNADELAELFARYASHMQRAKPVDE